jgi:Flp pilus assembly protein TadG
MPGVGPTADSPLCPEILRRFPLFALFGVAASAATVGVGSRGQMIPPDSAMRLVRRRDELAAGWTRARPGRADGRAPALFRVAGPVAAFPSLLYGALAAADRLRALGLHALRAKPMRRRRLRGDRRGVSAVEFALALPVLLVLMGGLTDLGLLWRARGRLAAAVNAGAQYAMLAGTRVASASVQAAVQGATTLSPLSIAVSGPACYCTSTGTGGGLSLTAATCGSTCSSGAAAGTYVMLSASYTYQPIMPLFSQVETTTLTEQAVVRQK